MHADSDSQNGILILNLPFQFAFFLHFGIEPLFPIIITSRSSNLVENFSFYETFIMDIFGKEFRGTI